MKYIHVYYNITNYKKEQINIWKNILFTIRLLCKNKFLNCEYFNSKFQLIYKNIVKLNYDYFNNIDISTVINEFIICFFILYDLNKENREKIKNVFENGILLLWFVISFLRGKENNLNEFLEKKENIDSFKGKFELYKLKYKIFFLLYNEEDNLEINDEEIINSLKNNKNLKDAINNSNNLFLREQKLEIPQFNIISLPDSFIELCLKYMNIICNVCKENRSSFFICLFCGKKICNSIECLSIMKNGKKEYTLFDHSKKCGGGNCLFLCNSKSELAYVLKGKLIYSDIYVYFNSFGEFANDDNLNESYVLNKVELQKGIQNFIDVTNRKKRK